MKTLLKVAIVVWTVGWNIGLQPVRAGDLSDAFRAPPDTTRPRCYWYWMDGCFSKDGITRDLEAMKRIGIGEAYIGIISGQAGKPIRSGVPALTGAWWEFLEHAVREGDRIGVDIGLFNSPGWSQSGGPWVKPEQAMRYLIFPEVRLRGPQRYEGKLPTPKGVWAPTAPFYQDVAVLAFPVTAGEGDVATVSGRSPGAIRFEMPAPFTARSLTVTQQKKGRFNATLEASDDGQSYRKVTDLIVDRTNLGVNVGPVPLAPVVVTFPAVRAKYFRLSFPPKAEVGEVALSSAPRVERYAEKALLKAFQEPQPPFDFYSWPLSPEPDIPVIRPDAVMDLTRNMAADGTLRWEIPEGEWIVLRAAMTPTGTVNSPAPKEGSGLEVDKINRVPLKAHFQAYVGELLKRLPADQRRAWKHVVADSYEMGPQNWSDGFAADFREAYGYDPLPWLPAMTGRVVGSAQQSDRFLWDVRRLVADRVAREYTGALRDLCRENGLKMWLENYGHWGFPAEFLQYGGACDEIGGEFWANGSLGSVELRCAASAAHIYGKPVVWAEAFTGGPQFRNAPRELKARGDWSFCEGVNQFVLHVYIHQPDENLRPGVNAWFGTEFNRHNTWFDDSKAWVDYLRRCSVLLQAGRPVADIAYFIGEDTPKMTGLCKPPVPAGYDFDYINAEVLLTRAAIKDGRLTLPDGVSYGVLVLPPSESMRPEVLKRIAQFVEQGLAVHGPLPSRSPSLQGFPACDVEVAKLTAALNGRVRNGDDLRPALKAGPDVRCPDGILWKHRQDDAADYYFVCNQKAGETQFPCTFRVSGRQPELWHPETGEIRDLPDYRIAEGQTEVPLRLGPTESVFVVFRKQAQANAAEKKNFPDFKPVTELTGGWQVQFDPKAGGPAEPVTFDALADWSSHSVAGIKYYSGAAVYHKAFKAELPASGQGRMYLDLGRVEALASVQLNGQDLGVLWKPPYRVDVSSVLKPGANELVVTVVNTWNNRLAGDAQPGAAQHVTFTTVKVSAKPMPAGLLGPVRLMTGE